VHRQTNPLPTSHGLSPRDNSASAPSGRFEKTDHDGFNSSVPVGGRDYAPFLLDACGHVVTWHEGAERIYGHERDDALGQHVAFLIQAKTFAV
jgi:hypothetical protein